MKHKVFVYGTLLSQGSNPAEKMVEAEVIGKAELYGTIFDLGWYPGLKMDAHHKSESGVVGNVKGEIISVDDAGLETLDHYEGAPYLYTRIKTVAFNPETKEITEVWTYEYNDSVSERDVVPLGDWIQYSNKKGL